jgi:hypothetical protein
MMTSAFEIIPQQTNKSFWRAFFKKRVLSVPRKRHALKGDNQ